MKEAEVLTPEMRIDRALRVIGMLGAKTQVDLLDLVVRVDAIAALLVRKGITTVEELDAVALESRAAVLEAVIADAQKVAGMPR